MPLDNSKYCLLIMAFSLKEPEKIIRILKNSGFHTCVAADIAHATALLQAKQADCIIYGQLQTDLLPTSISQHIPVLLVVPKINSRVTGELQFNNLDFIVSPFPSQELVLRIQHQLLLSKTERTILRQNTRLKKTLEARDKLYSVIAHDLRAPIGTIKMINSSIACQKSKIKNPDILKLFEMVNDTTEEAFNLLENLLRWTRNQNGKTKLYATHFNLSKSIRQMVSLFSTMANTKNITIYNHATTEHIIYADEDMIKTVLRNLLSNAVKFTYPGGKIDIDVTATGDCTLISIKDNGKGISKEIQKKLLKSEEYITTYGTRNEKGSGLGLILCQEFIKMNKGRFWFESQEGIGTTFFFTLPCSGFNSPPE